MNISKPDNKAYDMPAINFIKSLLTKFYTISNDNINIYMIL